MTDDPPSRSRLRLAVASLAWVLIATTSASAADADDPLRASIGEPRATARALESFESRSATRRLPQAVRFRIPALAPAGRLLDAGPLLHRASMPMEILSSHRPDWEPGAEHALHREMTEAVRRHAERTTRRALKRYLLEVSTLEGRFDEFQQRRRLRQAAGPDGLVEAEDSRMHFDFGFSHFLPEVKLRYELARADLKFSLSAEGKVNLRFRDTRLGGTEVQAAFDGDETYRLFCSFGFWPATPSPSTAASSFRNRIPG